MPSQTTLLTYSQKLDLNAFVHAVDDNETSERISTWCDMQTQTMTRRSTLYSSKQSVLRTMIALKKQDKRFMRDLRERFPILFEATRHCSNITLRHMDCDTVELRLVTRIDNHCIRDMYAILSR